MEGRYWQPTQCNKVQPSAHSDLGLIVLAEPVESFLFLCWAGTTESPAMWDIGQQMPGTLWVLSKWELPASLLMGHPEGRKKL